jgi:hypothetical protein
MNMVFGEAMRGRQLPQVEPQAASMGWPQFGQACSSIRTGADIDALISSGVGAPSSRLQARETLGFALTTGLDRRGFKTPRMIGLAAPMVKHLS